MTNAHSVSRTRCLGYSNKHGVINVADAIYPINCVFSGGPNPGDPDGDNYFNCF